MNVAGQLIPKAKVTFFTGLEKVKVVDSNRLPYGDYRVRIEAANFATAWREVRISEPNTLLRTELQLSWVGCPEAPLTIAGKVKGFNADDGETWVKAVPLRGVGGGGEDRVEETGQFRIGGLQPGEYVVMVLRGSAILQQQVVKTARVMDAVVIALPK